MLRARSVVVAEGSTCALIRSRVVSARKVKLARARPFMSSMGDRRDDPERLAFPADDVTARRSRLKKHNQILRSLAKSQANTKDEAAQLRAVTEAATETLEVARASVWLYGEGGERLIRCLDLFDANLGTHSSGMELRAADFGEYFAALEAERVISADDACTDPATRCFAEVYLKPLGITSMLDAPLRVGGRVVGVLCNEHVGPPRRWSDEDEAVAGSMADFVSLVLEGQVRRRAEEALLESQHQLAQAQKLDAIGQLAGGVAHDFNNLLTAILGYAEVAYDGLPTDNPHRADVQEILSAAERARDLTRQLLAFSRRQLLAPAPLDVNRCIEDLQKLVRRLIGEPITLEILPSSAPAWILADRNQIEQVIVNLAVNARDAMPNGGPLVIAVRCLPGATPEAGGDVVIEVSDAGHGIPAAIIGRIFEPFFTTKDASKGTGLGLSTVYGIVTQSGGRISVRSDGATGTTFEVRLRQIAPPSSRPAALTEERDHRGNETILVVEDDLQLRQLAFMTLEKLGYRVLLASGIDEAISIAQTFPDPIDLLVADVVLPKANGRMVAEEVRALRPDIAIMFVSGYGSEASAAFPDGPTAPLFSKPFTGRVLAGWVRAVLAERETPSAVVAA